ncbi:unnamed protein product [Cuscuta europaea]|uniref:Uncharacterized protein n=1 Tax=Cuscuta europaea TaxID=41803 RepID=A0A9P1E472_CUSEU|nr:unnamed protein product [Cuscuta europaea]
MNINDFRLEGFRFMPRSWQLKAIKIDGIFRALNAARNWKNPVQNFTAPNAANLILMGFQGDNNFQYKYFINYDRFKYPKKKQKINKNIMLSKLIRECNRYKVVNRVIDSTGNAPLLIWDNVGQEMFGNDVVDCQNMMLSSGCEKSYVPAEIETIVDVSMLFKVQIREEQIGNYNSAFSVMKFTRDEVLVEKFNVNRDDGQVHH